MFSPPSLATIAAVNPTVAASALSAPADLAATGFIQPERILAQIGLLPGTLLHNESARYIDRWVDVKIESTSPWLNNISELSLPIAHGEGRYYIDEKGMQELEKTGAIVGRYVVGDVASHLSLCSNPNGSLADIVGVTAYDGRVLGMMPHPERAVSFLQLPHWTYLKEAEYAGKALPTHGPGVHIFTNAANYFAL